MPRAGPGAAARRGGGMSTEEATGKERSGEGMPGDEGAGGGMPGGEMAGGVYALYHVETRQIVYVGRTTSYAARWRAHRGNPAFRDLAFAPLVSASGLCLVPSGPPGDGAADDQQIRTGPQQAPCHQPGEP